MNLGQQFTNQGQSDVSYQLSCFDRVILTGYLPFWGAGCVNKWIGGWLKIRHKDFLPQMKVLSGQLVDSAKRLAAQLHTKGIGFVQRDKAFLSLDDPQAAQRIADRFAALPWASVLDRFARQFNPLLSHHGLNGRAYSWFIDQAEYSTDVLFKDRNVLSDLFPRLLDHAVVNFRAQDIMTFLGRRLHPLFEGEVLTSCQKNRDPGARIKHLVANNWLKM